MIIELLIANSWRKKNQSRIKELEKRLAALEPPAPVEETAPPASSGGAPAPVEETAPPASSGGGAFVAIVLVASAIILAIADGGQPVDDREQRGLDILRMHGDGEEAYG